MSLKLIVFYYYTTAIHPALTRNKLLIHVTILMNLKNMLSAKSRKENNIQCTLPFISTSRKVTEIIIAVTFKGSRNI